MRAGDGLPWSTLTQIDLEISPSRHVFVRTAALQLARLCQRRCPGDLVQVTVQQVQVTVQQLQAASRSACLEV